MRVIALACPELEASARKAAGVPPSLPPFPGVLPACDFLYIDMHGLPDNDSFSCGFLAALPAHQVRLWDLHGTVVFTVSCHLAEKDNPLLGALLSAGARCVIAGDGLNYEGRGKRLYGAGLLGLHVRRAIARGATCRAALAYAKRRVKRSMLIDRLLGRKKQVLAARDALEFKVFSYG